MYMYLYMYTKIYKMYYDCYINFMSCIQMLIPRVSYFPLVYDKLERLYARAAGYQPADQDEIWLSSEDIPLKW